MTVTATEFHKLLFPILDRVLNGELVEVIYNGNTIRLTPSPTDKKLSRLIRRDTFTCSPDELEQLRRDLQPEMRQEMDKDLRQL